MKHELKMEPRYFKVAWAGKKPFEIRKNDRAFEVHDEVVLQECEGEEYTEREIHGVIEYLTEFGCQPGFVAFSYSEIGRRE